MMNNVQMRMAGPQIATFIERSQAKSNQGLGT